MVIGNQDHYLESIEIPEVGKYKEAKEFVPDGDLEIFKMIVGKTDGLVRLAGEIYHCTMWFTAES